MEEKAPNLDRNDQLTERLRQWADDVERQLESRVSRLTLSQRRRLIKSIRAATKMTDGAVSRMNFSFERHGIFVERGRFDAGGPKGRGTKGSRQREAKPWIAPVLDPAIDDLAEILANEFADMAAGSIKFTVPGVLNKRVKIGQ